MSPKPVQLILVPETWLRLTGWWWALCGAAALFLAPRAGSDLLAVLLPVAGVAALGFGLDLALARLVVTSDGIRVRGLVPSRTSVADITAVDARATSGLIQGKVRIEIQRRNGRDVKLTRLQRYANDAGWSAAHTDVVAIRQVLGLNSAERPAF